MKDSIRILLVRRSSGHASVRRHERVVVERRVLVVSWLVHLCGKNLIERSAVIVKKQRRLVSLGFSIPLDWVR